MHRFSYLITGQDGAVRTVPDVEYADLTLAMRAGQDPGTVFDALIDRGQIRVHASDPERLQVLASEAAQATAGTGADADTVLIADTREQVAALNAAIHDQLVAAGTVDDTHALTTSGGQAIGTGDRVATRRNNTHLNVANRDTWTITSMDKDGITVTGERGTRTLPAAYVCEHVELAYACTVHCAQGATTKTAQVLLSEHSTATSAYVAMTRGRHDNTAHLVAHDVHQAREAWVAVFTRDRADLGPGHARNLAQAEAARYAQARSLQDVVADLHAAWTEQARCTQRLERAAPTRDHLRQLVALRRDQDGQLAAVADQYEQKRRADDDAQARVTDSETLIAAHAAELRDGLVATWNAQRNNAREQGRVALAGPGRLGLRFAAVNRATDELARWSLTWQPVVPDMPTGTRQLAHYATRDDYPAYLQAAFARYVRAQAEQAHPEHRQLIAVAETTGREREQAARELNDIRRAHSDQLHRYGRLAYLDNPEERLHQLEQDITNTGDQLTATQARIGRLSAEPAITNQPAPFLATEHQSWKSQRDREAAQQAAARAAASENAARGRIRDAARQTHYLAPEPDHGPSIGR